MQEQGYTVAVLGATGLVGSKIIQLLEEKQFPIKQLKPLASKNSVGKTIPFKGQAIEIIEATADAFNGVDLVLASAGGAISERLVPEAVKRGCVVVDNTSFFRMRPDVPLVVAGVNDEDCKNHQGIIANPNCSTAQLMPVLKVLQQAAGLKRVIVSTYQSASGAGQKGIDALNTQLNAACNNALPEGDENKPFNRKLAYNLVPHIDSFLDNGYTKEENKLIEETKKILHLPELKVTATAVRVPVAVGHSESVTVELEKPLTPEQASELLKQHPLLKVFDDPTDYPTPLDCENAEPVLVGRIRKDTSNPETGLNLWVVADNLMIGAALNAVRIAQYLAQNQLLSQKVPV